MLAKWFNQQRRNSPVGQYGPTAFLGAGAIAVIMTAATITGSGPVSFSGPPLDNGFAASHAQDQSLIGAMMTDKAPQIGDTQPFHMNADTQMNMACSGCHTAPVAPNNLSLAVLLQTAPQWPIAGLGVLMVQDAIGGSSLFPTNDQATDGTGPVFQDAAAGACRSCHLGEAELLQASLSWENTATLATLHREHSHGAIQ